MCVVGSKRQANEQHVIPDLFQSRDKKKSPRKNQGRSYGAECYSAARVLRNADAAIRNLLLICDGNQCVNANVAWNKEHVMVFHKQNGPAITISLCHDCNTTDMGRKRITITQFRRRWDYQHDDKSQTKKM